MRFPGVLEKEGKRQKGHRIVVPTSQIFLNPDVSLGTKGFDPSSQKRINDYRKADVPVRFSIPGHLKVFMLDSLRRKIGNPAVELQRNLQRTSQTKEFPPV